MTKKDKQRVGSDLFWDLGSHLSAGISDLGKDKPAAIAFAGLAVVVVVVIILMAVVPSIGIRDFIGGSGNTGSTTSQAIKEDSASPASVSGKAEFAFTSQDKEAVEYLLSNFVQGAIQSADRISEGEDLLLTMTSQERTGVIYCTVNHPLESLDVYPISGGSRVLTQNDADKRSADLFGPDYSSFKPDDSYSGFINKSGSDWLFGCADGGAWYEASVGSAVNVAGVIVFDCLVAKEYDVGGMGDASYWTVSLEPDPENDFGYRIVSMVKADCDPTSHISECDTNIVVDEYNMPGRAVDGSLSSVWHGIVEGSESTELTVTLDSSQRLFGIAVSPGAYEMTATGSDVEFDVLDSNGKSLGSLYVSYYDYLDEDDCYSLLFDDPIDYSSLTLVVKSTDIEFGADSEFSGKFAPVAEIRLL